MWKFLVLMSLLVLTSANEVLQELQNVKVILTNALKFRIKEGNKDESISEKFLEKRNQKINVPKLINVNFSYTNSTANTTESVTQWFKLFFNSFGIKISTGWVIVILIAFPIAFIALLFLCCTKKRENTPKRKYKDVMMDMIPDDIDGDYYETICALYGKLCYTLELETKRKKLTVGIVRVINIPSVDENVDTYVSLIIESDIEDFETREFQTKVKKQNRYPVFNESFQIKCEHTMVHEINLTFQLFKYDLFSQGSMIGQFKLSLREVELQSYLNKAFENCVPFEVGIDLAKGYGDICFSMRYAPKKKKLLINILEAKNLKIGGKLTPIPNPYVSVKVTIGKTTQRKRTPQRVKTMNPYFNQDLIFVAPDVEDIDNCKIKIRVIHVSPVMKIKSTIGVVTLAEKSSTSTRMHWTETCNNPRHSFARWHSLQKSSTNDE